MGSKDIYREYCTGCGLCHCAKYLSFTTDESGFNWPDLNEDSVSFCSKVCPASGSALLRMNSKKMWGEYCEVKYGYSIEREIRKRASSGGVITALLVYMLDNKIVDAVIQTKADYRIPYKTMTVVNDTRDGVLSCMGSRYAISTPLLNILNIIDRKKKYVFVGKPCDVSALRLYIDNYDVKLKQTIPYLFSFFCAGVPSNIAQKKLIEALNCTIDECGELRYRGDGWPGFATCKNKNGTVTTMSYEDSWGTILGRDIRRSCRFCIDGIGELADISCGDAWYLSSDKKPDFHEYDGRNIVFARNETGRDILKSAVKDKYIAIEDADVNDFIHMQTYQYERKATMIGKLLALKRRNRMIPKYSMIKLLDYATHTKLRRIIKMYIGTIQRINSGRI